MIQIFEFTLVYVFVHVYFVVGGFFFPKNAGWSQTNHIVEAGFYLLFLSSRICPPSVGITNGHHKARIWPFFFYYGQEFLKNK